jgi:hypothetical protein
MKSMGKIEIGTYDYLSRFWLPVRFLFSCGMGFMVTMVTSKNIGIQIIRIFEYSRLPLVTRLVVDGSHHFLIRVLGQV